MGQSASPFFNLVRQFDGATATDTTQNNMLAAAPGDGAEDGTLYAVEIDCRNNVGEDVYVRFYDATAPTVGSNAAHLLLKGFKGTKKTHLFPSGIAFDTALSMAVVTNQGGTGGADSPSGTVNIRVGCDTSMAEGWPDTG